MPGTQGATNPFFSPDGQWLGFTAESKLKKIPDPGRPARHDLRRPGRAGRELGRRRHDPVRALGSSGVSRVGADGSAPRVVTKPDPKTAPGGHRWPQMLPGGKAALVSPVRSWRDEGRDIAAVVLATGESKVVVKGASYPRYVDGILFYARGGSILASAFDVGRLAVVGPEVTVLEDVRMSPRVTGSAFFEVASNGVAVFVPGFRAPSSGRSSGSTARAACDRSAPHLGPTRLRCSPRTGAASPSASRGPTATTSGSAIWPATPGRA